MLSTYLIRYGLMGHVGQFRSAAEPGVVFRRGQTVVIRSSRGEEIGEVLTASDELDLTDFVDEVAPPETDNHPSVYRAVNSEDLVRAHEANESRLLRFSMCERILKEAGRDWELLDIEPLLDGETIVLHYLGPHDPDAATLRARFRVACKFDVVLEPVGDGEPRDSAGGEHGQHECGRCGVPSAGRSGSESSGGGCGSCGSTAAGCASCALSEHIASRRR